MTGTHREAAERARAFIHAIVWAEHTPLWEPLSEAARAVTELQAPLVAKASGLAHKSERGLVSLDLSPQEGLDVWPRLAGAADGAVLIAEFVFREPVLFKFWDQLTHRLYGASRSSVHPDIDPFYASRPTVERFLQRLGDNLGTVGFGSNAVALILIGGAALTLIGGTVFVLKKRRSLEEPWRWLGILAAGWCVPAWYVVFSAHTMAHVPVMIRLLALPYAAAAILIVGAAVFGRRSVVA